MAEFTGLKTESFSTYEPSRWSSMVHNLARMKAKDAMIALADSATGDLGDTLAHLVRGASDEIPKSTVSGSTGTETKKTGKLFRTS